jgi:hypothetical protein
MKLNRFAGAAIAAAFIAFVHCTPDKVAGNGTLTGNPTVAGTVYAANGSPAANATVRFHPVGFNPKATAAADSLTTTTDASGRFSAPLDSGTYTIWDSGASGLAFRDSLRIMKGDTARCSDTLRAPGTLKGRVQMQGTDNPETVFIIFLGTNAFSMPLDTLGNFLIPNLPQGNYHVRFLTTLQNYTVLDTALSVTAGKIDTLASPIQLQYTGIPVPAGVQLKYDTNLQVVTLVWNKPTTGSPIRGYQVLRKNAAYNALPVAINSQIVTDTFYHDSSGVQDSGYLYYVAAVDTGNEVGGMGGGVGIKIQPLYHPVDSIAFNGSGWARIAIDDSGNIFVAENGIINQYSRNTKTIIATWPINSTFGTFQDIKLKDDSTLILASSTQIGELSLNDSTLSIFASDIGILNITCVNDTIYYITVHGNSNYFVRRLQLGSNSPQTIISNTISINSISTYSIQGIAASNSALVFAVVGNDSETICTANHDGSGISAISTLSSYTNQEPAICLSSDSIFISTLSPFANSITSSFFCILTTSRQIAFRWEIPNASFNIAKVMNSRIYSATIANVLIYGR